MQVPSGVSTLGALVGLAVLMAWRLRESRSTVSVKKIIAPPLGMATGFFMFVLPAFRISWELSLSAFAIGAIVLAYPMLRTSRLVKKGDTITIQRSNLFILIMVTLAIIRFIARNYFSTILSTQQTAALFFVLAFGMILRWRVQMLLEYRALTTKNLVLENTDKTHHP